MSIKPDFTKVSLYSNKLAEAFGMLTPKEVYAIRTVAWALPQNPIVVNLGAGTGTTSLAIAESRQDAHITTVDFSAGGPLGGLQNEINAFQPTPFRLPYQILQDSRKTGIMWSDYAGEQIDMLVIDADHSYEGCKGDYEAWYQYVKPGGFILFHDYDRDVWPDVKVVVDELVAANAIRKIFQIDTLFVATPVVHTAIVGSTTQKRTRQPRKKA